LCFILVVLQCRTNIPVFAVHCIKENLDGSWIEDIWAIKFKYFEFEEPNLQKRTCIGKICITKVFVGLILVVENRQERKKHMGWYGTG
jgi:hypothetical protein